MVVNFPKLNPAFNSNAQYQDQNAVQKQSCANKAAIAEMKMLKAEIKKAERRSFANINPELWGDLESVRQALNPAKELKSKVDVLDAAAKTNYDSSKIALEGLGLAVPTFRRVSSVPDALDGQNASRAAGMITLAALNLPGDLRNMEFGGRDLWNIYKKKPAVSSQFQYPMTFVRGTFIDKLANKSTICKNIYNSLSNFDNTLFDTKFGKFLVNKSNLEIADKINIADEWGLKKGTVLNSLKFEGSFASRLLGRTLMRISGLGLLASVGIETLGVVKAARTEGTFKDKAKAVVKQTIKAAGYIGLVTVGIAAAGAAATMMMPAAPFAAALVGMGVGSYIGLTASRGLNKQIDKAFS